MLPCTQKMWKDLVLSSILLSFSDPLSSVCTEGLETKLVGSALTQV